MSGDPDARVTVAARPRRNGAAASAPRRAGRRPRAPFLLALAATGLVAGIVLAYRATRRTRPAPPAPAPAAAPVDPLAAARAAESRGDLARAAQAFRDAYAASGDPALLEHLGALYERLGDRAQAAAYYQRYLDATPHPSEHQDIADRIARLTPPPRTGPADSTCECCADDAGPVTTRFLCPHVTSPLCSCRSPVADAELCPQPFVRCTQPPCDQLFAEGSDIIWWNCPERDYRELHLRGRPGAPCTGYVAGSLDPGDVQHPIPGELSCNFCLGDDRSDDAAYAIHGTAGAACTGYDPGNGELERGHVCCGR